MSITNLYPLRLNAMLTIHTALSFKQDSIASNPLVIESPRGYYVGTVCFVPDTPNRIEFEGYARWSLVYDDILDANKYLEAVQASIPTCSTEEFLLANSTKGVEIWQC